ncbi:MULTISPECIES: GNAT family N-acetyltransferase [Amylolactobacillus]|nr:MULTISPECIES: GNAT family N-acetyltransferase [Amylolactobacillus]APT18725.1 hypothetical protein LA20533_05385 [Amylolactobacillus amylophilus DSM 20533 = JCM 1125]GED80638.1 GNAT family acetyltransferase [Amylolactobacillus amylophilus]
MTVYLKRLNQADAAVEYEFFQKMPEINGFEVPYQNISFAEFLTNAIDEREDSSNGLNLPDGHVPDTYFFLWDNDKIVGLFKIRHYLNDFLRQGPGHIGYGILPEFQGRGYGTAGLKLALRKADKILPSNEPEIFLACAKTNLASLQVMKKNGGHVRHENEHEYFVRVLRKAIDEPTSLVGRAAKFEY